MKQMIWLVLAIVLGVNSIPAQDNKSAGLTLNRNPEKAEIVTSDLALFWRAYDLAKPENNLIIYRDEYLQFRKTIKTTVSRC